jgi:hypothetical protein
MHSRRKNLDPETLTASAKAMREMELTEYLATDFGRYEARLQLITFAADDRQSTNLSPDEEMLRSAVAFARRGNVVLAPSERSHAFQEFLAKRLSFRPGALGRLNANEPALCAAHQCELRRVVELINVINAHEREFYDFVCHSFSELYLELSRPRKVARQRRCYAPPASYVRAG